MTGRKAPRHAAPPAVIGTGTALPGHHYTQEQLRELATTVFPALSLHDDTLTRFFDRVGVRERFLSLPMEAYGALGGFGARSRAWLEVAVGLGEDAVTAGLVEAGLDASEVSHLMTTTVTGISVPTLDARLMNRMPFAPDTKRVPAFGLGCVGGAAGVARAADYLRAFPDEVAVLLSVELCSLTLQKDDTSLASVISAALFGDGAAAVVMAGGEHPAAAGARPRLLDSRSVFFEDTEQVMGWEVVDTGFKVVLSRDVPDIAREHIPPAVDTFLAEHALVRDDIATWVTHPGGPAVIDALEEGLGLGPDTLEPVRRSLAEVGNLSSASVLFLLDEYRREHAPAAGSYGLLMAMGPAFCAEMVLLQW